MSELELQQAQSAARSTYRGVFFRSWLQDPFNVAAIAPSGRMLAKLMATGLGPGARVVELGAGTGTLTDGVLRSGVSAKDLVLIEQHAEFVDILRRRFPTSSVLEIDAQSLDDRLRHLSGSIDFVISGLPLLWFDRAKKACILSAAFSLLRSTGSFHQFTYFGRPPIGRRLLESLRLKSELIGVSPINVPPAFVYRLQRA